MFAWLRRFAFSLTGKILVIYVPLAAMSVMALLGAVAGYEYFGGVGQLRQYVSEAARVNAPLLAQAIWQFKTADVVIAAKGIQSSASVLSVTIYDEGGHVIATAGDATVPPTPHDIVVSEPIFAPASSRALAETQIGRLVVESSTRIVARRIADTMSTGLLFLAAMVIALIAATLITTRVVIMRPLRLLEKSIEDGKDLQRATKVEWKSDDELGRVVGAYNDMIEYRAEASEMLRLANEDLEDRVHKRTQELEEARDRAQAATAAKASFLATMSHEIRTPMNGVVGMVDLLGETALDDDQRKMVDTVKASAYSLLGIIGDILDFSKLEAGRMRIESAPMSILDILESVGVTLWASAWQKGLLMPMFCDPRIPGRVYGDAVRIRQILTNLIGNAVKFTETTSERQGKVVVRADLVAEVMNRVWIRFSVADNGIGMDGEMKARLFHPFEQADASTVRRYGGTGLGLSICKHLMTLMGGEITVESAPDKGSTFCAEMWFDADADDQPESDLAGLRVLMLMRDRSSEAAEFLANYVTYWGATAEVANDYDSCINRLRAASRTDQKFDVLVVGVRLPRTEKTAFRDSIIAIPGLETLRFVFIDYEYQRAPAVIDRNTVTITGAPICRATFITGIAIAAGRASPETQSIAEQQALLPKVKAPTVAEAHAAGQLILVAEDNETNQDVVRRQLAALGYASVVVGDGQQALDAWRRGDYALLLTDCHMPAIDGYRLTEIIRAEERQTGVHFPIIAITANALHGEAERCLAVGMDDFVVKPIELHAFRRVLRRWMPESADAPADPSPLGAGPAATQLAPLQSNGALEDKSILDVSQLRRIVGDDAATVAAVLEDFEDPARRTISEIQAAFAAHDAGAIAFSAHKLKSSSRAVGAAMLADASFAIEQAGKSADWPALETLVPGLECALKAVVDRIAIALLEFDYAEA